MKRLSSIAGSKFARLAGQIAILALPLLILLPGWDGFVYSPRASFSDLVISHYPNAVFLLDALRHGQFPLWSPMILSGYPFAADPLAGIWYLPGWLAYLLPLPLGFNVNVFLHLLWSGVGMLLFLRALGLEHLPALAGALAWELLPKTFAHFGAGHLSLVYAIAWTPWLLLAEQFAFASKFRLAPGILLGLLTLADVRWLAYAGGLWLAFSLYRFSTAGAGSPAQFTKAGHAGWFMRFLGWGQYVTANVLLAGLIASPQLIPLAEFTRLSSRAALTAADNLTLSLDPLHWFGLIAPDFQSYAEWTVYLGALPLLALIWGLAYRDLRLHIHFWLGVLAAAGLLALGSNFLPNQWLARLPGMDLLRVPSRFMLIFGFASAVVLARFLQANLQNRVKGAYFWANLASFGSVVFPWIIVAGLWALTGSPSLPYVWGAVGLSVSVMWTMLKKRGWASPRFLWIAAVGLLVLDLGSVAQSNFTYRDPAVVQTERADVLKTVQQEPGLFRIYSPSYSIPQQTAAVFGQETVQGVDPLQLKTTLAFLQGATGIPMQRYSVTVPPFDSSDLAEGNQEYVPDAGLLGLLNVRFVIADYALQAGGLDEWRVSGAVHIYKNAAWRPRAWVQQAAGVNEAWQAVEIRERTPNRLLIQAEGPGELVLSEPDYPGWQVWVDGNPAQIHTAYALLRAVRLDAGSHRVEFTFQPLSVGLGLFFGMVGWLWAGVACLKSRESARA